MLAAITSRTRASILGACRPTWATRTSSTPSGTPSWRRLASKVSGTIDVFLGIKNLFLYAAGMSVRPNCDCGHRLCFSPSLNLATATSDLGPGHGTESREKVIRQVHDEARAG